MSKLRVLAFTAAAAGFLGAASTAQAATTLSIGSSSLCDGGGCFSDLNRSFTKTFTASDLGSSPFGSVSSLSIFKGLLGDLTGYAVKITFETKDGEVIGDWGAFTLSYLAGETVTIGGKEIAWDALAGDLVVRLDILMPSKGGGFGGGFGGGRFAAAPLGGPGAYGDIVVPRAPSFLAPPTGGLVADLRTAVPEPATWALMILGFGATGAVLRRQRFALRYG